MRVLVLGAGGAAANGYCRALRLADAGYHLIGANISADDLLLAECDETHLIEPDSIEALWDLVQKTKPDFAHAQPDEEVVRLAKARQTIRDPCRTFLPRMESILVCQDKWLSYLAWQKAKLTVPETTLVRGREALYNTITATGQPRWLRRIRGAGGAGSVVTGDFEFAKRWVDRQKGWGLFTSAEVLPGKSVTWTGIYWQGELVASQQRLRVSWANGRNAPTGVSGSTGIGETCSDPRVEEVAPAACMAIDEGAHGIWSVDMTYDAYGIPNPTEINVGRFFTTVPEFFARAGFNIAHLYTELGGRHPRGGTQFIPKPPNQLPDGIRWLRTMDKEPVLAAA